jgi:hypothetical protein
MAVGILSLLLLITLAKEYADGGAGDASVLPSLARVAQEGNQYSYQIAMIGLGLGSVMFCRVLFRARLVPNSWPCGGSSVMPFSRRGRLSKSSGTASAWLSQPDALMH